MAIEWTWFEPPSLKKVLNDTTSKSRPELSTWFLPKCLRLAPVLFKKGLLPASYLFAHVSVLKNPVNNVKGGSPGLVVMEGDSHSKGRGFESRRRILDGHDIVLYKFRWIDSNRVFLSTNKCSIKHCPWLDSKPRSLEMEATATTTATAPIVFTLSICLSIYLCVCMMQMHISCRQGKNLSLLSLPIWGKR